MTTIIQTPKSKKGGARKGAGRPATGINQTNIKINITDYNAIKEEAKKRKISVSKVVSILTTPIK